MYLREILICLSIQWFVNFPPYFIWSNIIVPALRGKDYGKTKMRYPDYTETQSGLQYKVNTNFIAADIIYKFLFPLLQQI